MTHRVKYGHLEVTFPLNASCINVPIEVNTGWAACPVVTKLPCSYLHYTLRTILIVVTAKFVLTGFTKDGAS